MDNYLKHLLPTNHPEAGWADVLASIPKDRTDYGEQIQVLKRALHNEKVSRLLDVGSGEGAFTQNVVELLGDFGLKSGDMQLDVIEKEASLFESLLQKPALASAVRLEHLPGDYTLPEQTDLLLRAIDRLGETHKHYDLIVASHVSYYFDNAGATLAYALASRLLSERGVLWMISRDRSCSLYRRRESMLLEEMLPDINRHSFSDSLIDRLCCLYDLDPDNQLFQMSLSHRHSTLNVPQDFSQRSLFFRYLLWLDNLSEAHLNFLSGLSGEMFSETHIFLPRLNKAMGESDSAIKRHENERNVMQQIGVVADCIDVVRRLAADVQVHHVSLASVAPTGETKPDLVKRAEPDLPSLLPPEFNLSSVGFGYYPEARKGDSTLTDFFEQNTSFLFYPRFYYDHQCAMPSSATPFVDYSVIRRLERPPCVTAADQYRIRESKTPPSIKPGNTSSPRFRESVEDWCARLERVYCSTISHENAQRVWTICVGSTVAADASQPFQDRLLNECCAFFLTVSSSSVTDLCYLAQSIVPQIRVRLTQWLGHKFFSDARRREDELKLRVFELHKQAQMLAVIQRPLRGISDSLSAMQSSTQEVRAILFEPEEALFASHAEIAPFFIDGQCNLFAKANVKGVQVHHTPDKYRHEPIRHVQLVFSGILCAIFGELERLRSQRHEVLIIEEAKDVLRSVEVNPATGSMAADLLWLLEQDNPGLSKLRSQRSDRFYLSELLDSSLNENDWKDIICKAIRNLKTALYSPFKPETRTWSPLAFKLLLKNRLFPRNLETHFEEMDFKHTPVSLAAVLSFTREIAVGLSSSSRTLEAFALKRVGSSKVLQIKWSSSITSGEPCVNVGFLKKNLLRLVKTPREWRVESANYGDVVRPFVMLTNKLLGLNEAAGWQPERQEGDVVLSVEQDGLDAWRYSISCHENTITHNWEKKS